MYQIGGLAVPLPIQLPANVPGKLVVSDPSSWDPVSLIGNQDGIPGSGL